MEIKPSTESPMQSGHLGGAAYDVTLRQALSYTDDTSTMRVLADLITEIPADLGLRRHSSLPRLEALLRLDAERGTHCARHLMFVAAVIHRDADERQTAEYLLRRIDEVRTGGRSAEWLLSSTRCAAEMALRRARGLESAMPDDAMDRLVEETVACRTDDPSVGEAVLEFLHRVVDYAPTCEQSRDRILDAVTIAIELAERHWLKRGQVPSVLAMRSDARHDARLVTHLREALKDAVAARCIARVLVGSDGSAIDSSLLWWASGAAGDEVDLPEKTRARWHQDLRCAERSLVTSIGVAA